MDVHFGHNCSNYMPTLGKCRVLIEQRSQRPDLLSARWVGASEAMVYSGQTPDQLVERVTNGQVGVKRLKNGRLTFRLQASWDWDDCPLGDAGGQCVFFAAHDGQIIRCLRDLETMDAEHPNLAKAPTAADLEWVEQQFGYVQPGEVVESF